MARGRMVLVSGLAVTGLVIGVGAALASSARDDGPVSRDPVSDPAAEAAATKPPAVAPAAVSTPATSTGPGTRTTPTPAPTPTPTPAPTDGGAQSARRVEISNPERLGGKPVLVRVGDEVVVHLSEQAGSTGYAWSVVTVPEILASAGDKVTGPPENPSRPLVGAPGTHSFAFRAVASGTGRLSVALRRPWEPTPVKTVVLTLTAHP